MSYDYCYDQIACLVQTRYEIPKRLILLKGVALSSKAFIFFYLCLTEGWQISCCLRNLDKCLNMPYHMVKFAFIFNGIYMSNMHKLSGSEHISYTL